MSERTPCPNCGQPWRGYTDDLPGVRSSVCCGQPQSVLLTAEDSRRSERPCARKGCGRPMSEHDYGVFCP